MRKITVEITLNDEWESYFDCDTYTCDSLIVEDLFEGFKKMESKIFNSLIEDLKYIKQ